MRNNKLGKLRLLAATSALAVASFVAAPAANAAIQITVYNNNAAGIGFNDPTPVAPVGGNPGTTLGEQRIYAFLFAADKWGATLTSNVEVRILAQFTALTCTPTGAVLGSAGATTVFRDFTNAPVVATWYSSALADKLTGIDLSPLNNTLSGFDINANFNVNLGNPGCLTGVPFYFGLDNNHGTAVDFVTVLTHEMGHGLGFQTFTNGSTGAQLAGFPAMWDRFLLDNTTGLNWTQMTGAERQASAIGVNKLVWTGPNVSANVPLVLRGTPRLTIGGPAAGATAGTYLIGSASFGAPLASPGLSADVMPMSAANADGCLSFGAADKTAVTGNIALINRGVCGFVIKVKNAQLAGAVGVIIADNVAGSPPPDLGGTDPTITIPSVRITLGDATTLRTALTKRSRTKSGVIATLDTNTAVLAGADAFKRIKMYTPNPYQGGSSVSHYDTTATPNQLMEPAINGDLTHEVTVPFDLTYELFKDIGW
ncbi:MAG: PA domain-containing protein [Pseudomonadota bacterium]